MSVPTLKIGGVEFALQTFPMRQEYRPINGSTQGRMQSGAAFKQTHWSKLGTRISGSGWAPPAMAGIAWGSAVEIYCIQPRAVFSATASATLPAARRTDGTDPVLARAVVGSQLVETPLASLVGNVATATAVSGATGYQFHYYPKLSFYSDGPTESLDATSGEYGWSLEAEEV